MNHQRNCKYIRKRPGQKSSGNRVFRCRFPFTMLEILLVTVIAAILTTMLVPGVWRARKMSYRADCTYNLRAVGLSLKAYEIDYAIFPIDDPLMATLDESGYMNEPGDFRCPLDKTADGDTYSLGYLSFHPKSMSDSDPLVVCGWHRQYGTLAVFSQANVGILKSSDGQDILPVTVFAGSTVVDPGFVLHSSDPIVMKNASGDQEALIYGNNGASYITASYDPLASFGTGMFTITVGFDTLTTSPAVQYVKGESATYLEFQAKFQYVTVEVYSDPTGPFTKLSWQPKGGYNKLTISKYSGYRVIHRYTGAAEETSTPGVNKIYKPTATSLGG